MNNIFSKFAVNFKMHGGIITGGGMSGEGS